MNNNTNFFEINADPKILFCCDTCKPQEENSTYFLTNLEELKNVINSRWMTLVSINKCRSCYYQVKNLREQAHVFSPFEKGHSYDFRDGTHSYEVCFENKNYEKEFGHYFIRDTICKENSNDNYETITISSKQLLEEIKEGSILDVWSCLPIYDTLKEELIKKFLTLEKNEEHLKECLYTVVKTQRTKSAIK